MKRYRTLFYFFITSFATISFILFLPSTYVGEAYDSFSPAIEVTVTESTYIPVTEQITTEPQTLASESLPDTIIIPETQMVETTVITEEIQAETIAETTVPVVIYPDYLSNDTLPYLDILIPPVEDGIKYVAFTFDDGPQPALTRLFVDKMNEYGGRGTFFVVGDRLNESSGADMRYAADYGWDIGIHAYSHKFSFAKCDDYTYNNEVECCAAAIRTYVGVEPWLLRPPGGNITPERAAASNYPVILWNVDTKDWQYKARGNENVHQYNVNTIVNYILGNTSNGSIILMHEIYINSYDAFCIAADTLYSQGYKFVTVTELLSMASGSVYAGTIYHSTTIVN